MDGKSFINNGEWDKQIMIYSWCILHVYVIYSLEVYKWKHVIFN